MLTSYNLEPRMVIFCNLLYLFGQIHNFLWDWSAILNTLSSLLYVTDPVISSLSVKFWKQTFALFSLHFAASFYPLRFWC